MAEVKDINLIVSCPNEGGLVHIQKGIPTYLDSISTTGICIYEGRLFRCIQNTIDTPLRMIVYGKEGKVSLVFPDIRDVHDILGYEGRLFVVSTGTNEVFEVSAESYEVLTRFKFKGKGDAWHLNCLEAHESSLVLTAFGKFRRHRGYKGKTPGKGIAIDLLTGKIILKGFSQPHSPKIIDGRLFVCDSEKKTVERIDLQSGSKTILEFENYTRGISFSDEYIFVGVSSSRNIARESKSSKVVVLNRKTLERMHEIELRYSEIYSICTVPFNLKLALE